MVSEVFNINDKETQATMDSASSSLLLATPRLNIHVVVLYTHNIFLYV
jgi:hypothetical protein